MGLEDKLTRKEFVEFIQLGMELKKLRKRYKKEHSWPKGKKVTYSYVADFYDRQKEFDRYISLYLKAYGPGGPKE